MLSSNDIDVEKYFWSSPVAQLSLSHPVAWGMGGVWAYSKHQHPCFGPRARLKGWWMLMVVRAAASTQRKSEMAIWAGYSFFPLSSWQMRVMEIAHKLRNQLSVRHAEHRREQTDGRRQQPKCQGRLPDEQAGNLLKAVY